METEMKGVKTEERGSLSPLRFHPICICPTDRQGARANVQQVGRLHCIWPTQVQSSHHICSPELTSSENRARSKL